MNAVILHVEVRRATPERCSIGLNIEGAGDDQVEQWAEELKRAIEGKMKELVARQGGKFIGPQETES